MQWVIVGEVILFAALVGLAISGGGESLTSLDKSAQPTWVSGLLLFGFGTKAGLLATHFWLPRAHPVAPVPASALLSGLMVKAGLIGWWRFLPLGSVTIAEIGAVLMTLGFGGAIFGVIMGFMQRNPKTLLAYSTISQMGIIAAGIGAGLWSPALWPTLSAALLIYAAHHGFAKAALFLSVGLKVPLSSPARWLYGIGVIIPVLAMVGFPLTSGALAKSALKSSVEELTLFAFLLPVTTIGTTLLLLRFMDLVRKANKSRSIATPAFNRQNLAYFMLICVVLSFVFIIPQSTLLLQKATDLSALWSLFWPILAGSSVYLIVRSSMTRWENSPTLQISTVSALVRPALLRVTFGIRALSSNILDYWKRFASSINYFSAESDFSQLIAPRIQPGIIFILVFMCLCVSLAFNGLL